MAGAMMLVGMGGLGLLSLGFVFLAGILLGEPAYLLSTDQAPRAVAILAGAGAFVLVGAGISRRDRLSHLAGATALPLLICLVTLDTLGASATAYPGTDYAANKIMSGLVSDFVLIVAWLPLLLPQTWRDVWGRRT